MKVDVNRLRFKDWKEIEQLTGKKMGWFAAELQNGMGNMGAEDFEILVWVAAKRTDPSFTRDQASELGPADLAVQPDPTQSGDG